MEYFDKPMSEAKRNLQKVQFDMANIEYAIQDVRGYVQYMEDVGVKNPYMVKVLTKVLEDLKSQYQVQRQILSK
jgi:C4-dicarboxylate transporter